MRPVRLEMEAFGPFSGSTEVDFSALPADRPFLIGGPTGSGKTSIFDAMTFALYGTLPGHRHSHHAVRSDHAAPAAECEVTFEFDLGAEHWRITRRPKQRRAARRGTGTATVENTARLERRAAGGWETVASRLADVRERIEQIVGLTAAQFERVVLLPQGDFEKVLNAGTSERENLLRTLFGTGLYLRATERLDEERKGLRVALRDVESRTSTQRSAAAEMLERVRTGLEGADVRGGTDGDDRADAVVIDITSGTSGADGDGRDVAYGSAEAEVPSAEQLRSVLEAIEVGSLQERRAVADAAGAAAEAAERSSAEAKEVESALTRRRELREDLAALERDRDRHDAARSSVAAARAVAPIVDLLERRDRAGRRSSECSEMCDVAWGEMLEQCRSASVDLDGRPHGPEGHEAERRGPDPSVAEAAAEACTTAIGRFEQLADDLARAARLRTSASEGAADRSRLVLRCEEIERLLADAETTAAELTEERDRASRLAAGRGGAEESAGRADTAVRRRQALESSREDLRRTTDRIAELVSRRDDLTAEREGAESERSDSVATGSELVGLAEAVTDAEARRVARDHLEGLRRELDVARREADTADSRSRVVFEGFVAGAAPWLATELREGEPCAVCGSTEHPAPAGRGVEEHVEPDAVDQARDAANAARRRQTDLESELSALLQRHPQLASATVDALDDDVAAARRAHHDAVTAHERVELLTRRIALTSSSIDDMNGELRALEQARAVLDGEVERAIGALEADADRPVEALEAQAVELRAVLDAAVAAGEQLPELEERRRELELTRGSARTELTELRSRVVLTEGEFRRQEVEASALEAEVEDVTAGVAPAELADRARGARIACRRARDAAVELRTARRNHDELVAESAEALSGASLSDDREARRAGLASEELSALEAWIADWSTRAAVTSAALGDLESFELPDLAPDVEGLTADAVAARGRATDARDTVVAAERDLENARRLLEASDDLERTHRAERDRLDLLDDVVGVLGGHRSGQNVTLEAWVLSAFLREVVEAANEHLRSMTHGRYELSVDSTHVRGRVRAGLDLAVLDAHTGRCRPTASLSGGETFQASLALALGLSDALTAGSGGVRVDALFIDEGFGSLDGAAVDTAIEVLDGLRDRGTMVGVVTHVEQMKDALPVAIEVAPRGDRRGSELRQLVSA